MVPFPPSPESASSSPYLAPQPCPAEEATFAESDEAEPAPSSEEEESSDSDDEAFLSQLAQALAEPSAKRICLPAIAAATSDLGPADWPVEVKSAIGAFLPWRELPTAARISQTWRGLERSETLWQEYFRIQWPRLFHRKAAGQPQGGVPWRALFRQRWAEPDRNEDAEQEDWNDFSAAMDLWRSSGTLQKSLPEDKVEKPLSEERQILIAVSRFKEDVLRLRGMTVPAVPLEATAAEHCHQRQVKCRHRPVPIAGKLDGCLFVCERCGDVHVCRPNVVCEGALLTDTSEFLVCTVSGLCADSGRTLIPPKSEDAGGADATSHDWDPELSASQQHARWFEQGYCMDADQADDYFDGGSASRKRKHLMQKQRSRAHVAAGGSSGVSAHSKSQAPCCR